MVIGSGSIVGAGAVVTEVTVIPPGSLVLGIPGKVVGAVSEEQRERIRQAAVHYVEAARVHHQPDRLPEIQPSRDWTVWTTHRNQQARVRSLL